MQAADIMTRNVVTVAPEAPVRKVVQSLLARDISGVPVVDADGVVVGFISEGDLLRRAELGTEKHRSAWRRFFAGTATLAGEYVRAYGEVAQDIMTRDVVTVAPSTDVAEIAELMEARHIKCVPVVDGRKLVGFVSRSNLLRAFASTPERPQVTFGDDTIRTSLLGVLADQPWSRHTDNAILVNDGVVHLWGVVAVREEARAMELVAHGVPGVRAVQNHMIVLAEEDYPRDPVR